jgi:hypothetical protein
MKPANYQTPKNTRGGKNALAQTLRRAFQPLSEDLACAALMAKPSREPDHLRRTQQLPDLRSA